MGAHRRSRRARRRGTPAAAWAQEGDHRLYTRPQRGTAALESALLDACPLVLHACAVGEGRPHIAAIIAIDPAHGQDDTVGRAVAAAIEQVNAGFDPRERIEAHAIVTDPWLPGAELTETLKLRRC